MSAPRNQRNDRRDNLAGRLSAADLGRVEALKQLQALQELQRCLDICRCNLVTMYQIPAERYESLNYPANIAVLAFYDVQPNVIALCQEMRNKTQYRIE